MLQKYKNTEIIQVVKEFNNNSEMTLLLEISENRKAINNMVDLIREAIKDLKRPHSDGSIALEKLEKLFN